MRLELTNCLNNLYKFIMSLLKSRSLRLAAFARVVAFSMALLMPLTLLQVGCASIQFNSRYTSDIRHDPLPLKASVNVVLTPELRKEWEDRKGPIESIRQSFQDALKADLLENGPFTPNTAAPEARLVIKLKEVKFADTKLWIMMWFLAPLWLFAVPMTKLSLHIHAELEMKTAASGDVLYFSDQAADCSMFQGVYYGHKNLSFGCAVKKITERMRDQMSMDRADIMAKVDRMRPSPVAKPVVAEGDRPIAVVFQIQDMSGKFEENLVAQLTEYLSAQVGQKLRYKVAPREQLRDRLGAAKKESYKQCYDRSCQIEMGKALAANKTVSTSLIRIGSNCVFNATVMDLKTEAAELSASFTGKCDEDSLLVSLDKVVKVLARGVK